MYGAAVSAEYQPTKVPLTTTAGAAPTSLAAAPCLEFDFNNGCNGEKSG